MFLSKKSSLKFNCYQSTRLVTDREGELESCGRTSFFALLAFNILQALPQASALVAFRAKNHAND